MASGFSPCSHPCPGARRTGPPRRPARLLVSLCALALVCLAAADTPEAALDRAEKAGDFALAMQAAERMRLANRLEDAEAAVASITNHRWPDSMNAAARVWQTAEASGDWWLMVSLLGSMFSLKSAGIGFPYSPPGWVDWCTKAYETGMRVQDSYPDAPEIWMKMVWFLWSCPELAARAVPEITRSVRDKWPAKAWEFRALTVTMPQVPMTPDDRVAEMRKLLAETAGREAWSSQSGACLTIMAHALANFKAWDAAEQAARAALAYPKFVSELSEGRAYWMWKQQVLLASVLFEGRHDPSAFDYALAAADSFDEYDRAWGSDPAARANLGYLLVTTEQGAFLRVLHYFGADGRVRGLLERARPQVSGAGAGLVNLLLGVVRYWQGDLTAAEQLLRDAPNPGRLKPMLLLWLARTLLAQGRIDEADVLFKQVWASEASAGWEARPDYVDARFDYAVAELGMGRAAQAEALASKSLDEARNAANPDDELQALMVLSLALQNQGKEQEAARTAEQASALARAAADREGKVAAASTLAAVYSEMGAESLASSAAGESIVGPPVRRRGPEFLRQLGRALALQGHLDEARRALQMALRLDQLVSNRAAVADDCYFLALVAGGRDQPAEEADLLARAIDAARSVGYRNLEANAFIELVGARLALGQTPAAVEASKGLVAAMQGLKSPPLQVREGIALGWLGEAKGDDLAAVRHYVASAQALEQIRGGLSVEALHLGLLRTRGTAYQRLVPILAGMAASGRQVEIDGLPAQDPSLLALHYAEAGRARALLSMMSGVFSTRLDGLSPADAAEVEALDDKVTTARQALFSAAEKPAPDRAEVAGLADDLRQARAARDAFRERMLTRYPAAGLRAGRVKVLDPAGALQACANHSCAALEYWVGDQESWGWVLNPWQRQVKLFRVPMGRRELADAVDRLQKAFAATPPATEVADAALVQLSDALLAPAAALLPQGKSLVLVPDGPLQDLPFVLLKCQGQRLLDRATVSYVPSLTVLGALTSAAWTPGAPRKVTVLARPKSPDPRFVDLPGTEQEARAIGEAWGSAATILIGDRATEAAATGAAATCDVLHLAAHGLLDRAQPAHSAVLLTPSPPDDGLLEAGEVAALPIKASLVVLSACRSASGGYVAGEGLLGLTRAFFAGGARGIVASQWQVPDEPVGKLMGVFYRELGKSGDPVRALQAAQLQASQTQPAAEWAPFAYFGAP